jgi:hypothetical protein
MPAISSTRQVLLPSAQQQHQAGEALASHLWLGPHYLGHTRVPTTGAGDQPGRSPGNARLQGDTGCSSAAQQRDLRRRRKTMRRRGVVMKTVRAPQVSLVLPQGGQVLPALHGEAVPPSAEREAREAMQGGTLQQG